LNDKINKNSDENGKVKVNITIKTDVESAIFAAIIKGNITVTADDLINGNVTNAIL